MLKLTFRNHKITVSQLRLIQFVLLVGFFLRSIAVAITDWHTVQPNEIVGIGNMVVLLICIVITMRDPKDTD